MFFFLTLTSYYYYVCIYDVLNHWEFSYGILILHLYSKVRIHTVMIFLYNFFLFSDLEFCIYRILVASRSLHLLRLEFFWRNVVFGYLMFYRLNFFFIGSIIWNLFNHKNLHLFKFNFSKEMLFFNLYDVLYNKFFPPKVLYKINWIIKIIQA